MRVLIVAFACDPRQGSESFIGWNAIQALRGRVDLEVITSENNRLGLEKEAAEGPFFLYSSLLLLGHFWDGAIC